MLVAVVVVVVVVGKGSIVRTAGAFVTHLMPDLCQSGVHWLRSPIECHVSEVDLKPLTPPFPHLPTPSLLNLTPPTCTCDLFSRHTDPATCILPFLSHHHTPRTVLLLLPPGCVP